MHLVITFIIFIMFLFSAFWYKRNLLFIFPLYFSISYLYSFLGISFNMDAILNIPFYDQLLTNEITGTGISILFSSVFLILGGKVSQCFLKTRRKNINLYINMKRYEKIIFLLYFVLLVITLFAFDFKQLFYRQGYLIDSNHSFVKLFKILSPIVSFLCVFVEKRLVKYLLFFSILIIPFGLNSRLMSVNILVFYLGCLVMNINKYSLRKVEQTTIIGLLIISFFSSFIFRFHDEQGIIPGIYYLFVLSFDYERVVTAFNYFSSFSIFAIQYTIDNKIGDLESIFFSFNPLPTAMVAKAKVDLIVSNSMINLYSPVPGLGMLYNQGLFVLSIYYFICGIILKKLEINSTGNLFSGVFLVILILFVFLNSQYFLRESVRLIYLSAFLNFSFMVSRRFRF